VHDKASNTTDPKSPPGDILHPGSRTIFRHWESIRGESSAADREDLDLSQLGKYVPWLFVIERSTRTNSYIWRLAGSKICDLWRKELTGSDVFSGWDTFERDTVRRLFDGVTRDLQPCTLRLRLFTSLGQTVEVEFIALPLRARDGHSIHVFGGVMPFREHGLLGYDRISALELASARTIWTEPVPGGQDRKARPALRLVTGGDA
jgi:hypothetical protein